MIKKTIPGLIACLAIPQITAFAAQKTSQPRSSPLGIRAAAMGNAFTAVADDQNALYYNPAGLLRQDWSFEVLSVYVGTGANVIQSVKDVQSAQSGIGASTAETIDAVQKIISAVNAKNHFVKFGLNPNVVIPPFGLGVLQDFELNMTVHDPAPKFIDLSVASETDIRLAYAHEFFDQKLSIGTALAFKHLIAVDEAIETDYIDTATGGSDKLKKKLSEIVHAGNGVGLDLGILFTPVKTWEPTFGLAILNVADTRFFGSKFTTGLTTSVPESIPQTINVGASMTPRWGDWFARGSIEFRNITSTIPAGRKFSLGTEGGWGNIIRVQAGLSEGYLSAGFETRLWVLNLRYATYVTEWGSFPGVAAERRHLIGAKVLF